MNLNKSNTVKAENNARNSKVKSSSHKSFLLTQLDKFRTESRLCDVTLVVKGARINAHRLVLAASSKYFEAMFSSGMVESREHDIKMNGIEARTLDALVNFCYSGEVNIDDNNVQDILAGACLLQLSEVKELCCDFLKKGISLSNCLQIRAVAETYACQTLLHFANGFILLNFQSVLGLEEFHHLPVKQVNELISSDLLLARSEEQVFEAVMKWVSFDLTTRKSLLFQLLRHVRLPLCQPKFLVGTVSTNALVMADAACRNLVDEAKNYQLLQLTTPVQPNMQGPRTRPRNPFRDMLRASGGATTKSSEEWARYLSRVRVTPVRRLSRATP
ncbi:BACK domain-containing protein [Trichostrongylus colubriformis]|uniref:BACK domain-containing protein n=1 Tax=Trichostrongylus colubriformis TaxID=6319 RepID=A0AAN8FTT4_TRICO